MCNDKSCTDANGSLRSQELFESRNDTLPISSSPASKLKTSTTPSRPRITTRAYSSAAAGKHATSELCEVNDREKKAGSVDTCFICTEPINIYAISRCNHRICYVCSLRSRALFETNSCPYCRAQQQKVIFTRDIESSFAELMSSKAWYIIPDLQILCEDQQIYQLATNMIRLRCPIKSCQVACDDGWLELSQHVRACHKLMFCSRCVTHRRIFAWEHRLYSKEELRHHYRNGDGKDSNFQGHPSCGECGTAFYDLIEFREHYLMHHHHSDSDPSRSTLRRNSSTSRGVAFMGQTLIPTNILSSTNHNGITLNEGNDMSFLIFCVISVLVTLVGSFALPNTNNRYFSSVIQTLDETFSSIFSFILQINVEDSSHFDTLHTIFISIYSMGIRLLFAIAYLTMIFLVLKSWFIIMSWLLYGVCAFMMMKICWENWTRCIS